METQKHQIFTIPFIMPLVSLENLAKSKARDFMKGNGPSLDVVHLYGQDHKMCIECDLSGVFGGRILLSMIPAFDVEADAFVLEDVEISTEGDSWISKASGWFTSTFLKGKIDSKLAELITTQYRKFKLERVGKHNVINLPMGFTLQGILQDLHISDIEIATASLHCLIHVKGEFSIYGPDDGFENVNEKAKA